MNNQTTFIHKQKNPRRSLEQHLRNKITNHQNAFNKQLERNVDVCNKAKRMAQGMVCLGSRTRTYFLKKCNIEKNEAWYQFQLKIIKKKFVDLAPIFYLLLYLLIYLFIYMKGVIGNTRLLLIYYH